jgi:hypothetical protein
MVSNNQLGGLAADNDVKVQRASVTIRPGQWYWVLEECKGGQHPVDGSGSDATLDLAVLSAPDGPNLATEGSVPTPAGKVKAWFGCLTKIGSNYVQIEEPWSSSWRRAVRIHIDDFWSELLHEPNSDAVIQARVAAAQADSNRLLAQIQEITARLGVGPAAAITSSQGPTDREERALVVMTHTVDASAYKTALVKAKEETLPALFKEVKEANEQMVRWMSAGALSLQAYAGELKPVLEEINQRLFTVSLYAGLTEEVVKVRDGEPAAPDEKVRVMQRRLFMDEEALFYYQTGGMEFKNIGEFDAWLAEPEHMNALLPFQRCIVAMRVRRTKKDRDFNGTLEQAFVIMRLEQADLLTFLYLRNGDRLYRLSTELDFDGLIFPSRDEFDPTEPLMFSMSGGDVDKIITRSDYEARRNADLERKARAAAWAKANKARPKCDQESFNPHERDDDWDFTRRTWYPFDPSSVYYDEASMAVAERVRKYNRVAVILQGLFDRSEVFHPHPPVQTWTPDGFSRAIELIYDGSDVLVNGDPPDFEAYRAQLNAQMTASSVVIGQERVWMEREAERENERISKDWRAKTKHYHTLYEPYGNPGPGFIARMSGWKPRAQVARFTWFRKRLRGIGYFGDDYAPIECSIDVPAQNLLNASAYVPGDFKKFWADRRTRAQYLKWAPFLMAAEEFHAGNLKPQEPGEGPEIPNKRRRR